jgi:hypothetical protein
MTTTLTGAEREALRNGGTRTFGGRPILWHDGRLVHACIAAAPEPSVRQAHTLCRRIACCHELVFSLDVLVTCPACHAAAVDLGVPDHQWLAERLGAA